MYRRTIHQYRCALDQRWTGCRVQLRAVYHCCTDGNNGTGCAVPRPLGSQASSTSSAHELIISEARSGFATPRRALLAAVRTSTRRLERSAV